MKENTHTISLNPRNAVIVSLVFFGAGLAGFISGLSGDHPGRVWEAFLINFLLFTAIAQGAVLFSAVMRMTKARWAGVLAGLSEAFVAFFPISFVLFFILFIGKEALFPWLHMDLKGKEVWLNIPFLFGRDGLGLIILYILGFVYLHYSMKLRIMRCKGEVGCGRIQKALLSRMQNGNDSRQTTRNKATVAAGLYITAFVLVQSLLGYDLVMSADPHWLSTLFGAYTFIKAFYIGLGSLIILASYYRFKSGEASGFTSADFHDVGKLFFAFCLLWADFFYVQFLVIWYGNLPEETSYIITRTMMGPWKPVAWLVFIVCFIIPFIILLNKAVKTKPGFMTVLCAMVIVGMWMEHYLLLSPALYAHSSGIGLGYVDGLVFLGVLGMLIFSVISFLSFFPELLLDANGKGERR